MTWQERLREKPRLNTVQQKESEKRERVHLVLEGSKELFELLIPDSIWKISNIKLDRTEDHQRPTTTWWNEGSLTLTPGASSMTFSVTPFEVATAAGTSAIVKLKG